MDLEIMEQTIFTRGEKFLREEGSSVEFKEVTSQRPGNTIVKHSEEYVIGFLNAQINGDLYFGIDDSGIVRGVTLSRNDRDEISRSIPNKLRSTDPPVSTRYYEIFFHNILDSDQLPLKDLNIVQIHINKVEDRDLYKTSGGSVYLKKGSSCLKLGSAEIRQEIEIRTQKNLTKKLNQLNKKLEEDPDNRSILKEKVEVAKLMNDIETMDETYKKLIELNPEKPEIRASYAAAHKNIGDLEGALSILNDASQSDTNSSSILKDKGLILLGLERLNEALSSYQEALKSNPDDYTIITQIGITFRHLGKYSESIQFLNYALSKAPSYRLAKYEKRKTYYKVFEGGVKKKGDPDPK